MKYFRIPMKDILWRYSYVNIAMLMSSIPSYSPEDEKKRKMNDLEIKDINELKGLL